MTVCFEVGLAQRQLKPLTSLTERSTNTPVHLRGIKFNDAIDPSSIGGRSSELARWEGGEEKEEEDRECCPLDHTAYSCQSNTSTDKFD